MTDLAVRQRAVLTEGLQGTGGDTQQEAGLLIVHPFPHSLPTVFLTKFIRNTDRILQTFQHTFKDIRFDNDDFHKRIQLVRNKCMDKAISCPNACPQMSANIIRCQHACGMVWSRQGKINREKTKGVQTGRKNSTETCTI